MNFDGARLAKVDENTILMSTQTGIFIVIQLFYDQAQIDLANVVFFKLEDGEKRVASSIAMLWGKVFCTSFFQPTTLFNLSEGEALESDPKRQKTSTNQEIGKRKQYHFYSLDSLPCLSPITSAI